MKVQRTDLFLKWIIGLKDNGAKRTIDQKIRRIEQDGYIGRTEPIKGYKNISEIRFHAGAGYRIYINVYIQDNEIWLLNGGNKSTQEKDIEAAQELLQEIQEKREAKKNEQIQTHNTRGR